MTSRYNIETSGHDPYTAALDGEPSNLSSDRAAHHIGVSRRTLDRLISAGRIRTAKIGSRRLIPREALREFLLANLEGGR